MLTIIIVKLNIVSSSQLTMQLARFWHRLFLCHPYCKLVSREGTTLHYFTRSTNCPLLSFIMSYRQWNLIFTGSKLLTPSLHASAYLTHDPGTDLGCLYEHTDITNDTSTQQHVVDVWWRHLYMPVENKITIILNIKTLRFGHTTKCFETLLHTSFNIL